ncbi:DUF2139 domain-containing protein [Thermogladius sp. 4427co]|uniref:DUF2139 domain-containing protein n=1 Tax=Thermogladius sp. 4427co TaxID=3450718 RepID=UPI003F7A3229
MKYIDYLVKPGYGPEWGSGGVFGLKYYRGVLYYTISMEAEAHFHHGEEEIIYKFQYLGPGPASGGDTYNAVETVDDSIFFGGWVHNPAVYKERRGFEGEIDFRNKYSHVHEYRIGERSVRLVWSDSVHHEKEWAGEVSEIIYDRINDRLMLARADGSFNLGIYALDYKKGAVERVSDIPGLKGSLYLEFVCFDMQPDWRRGVDGVQCYDPYSNKIVFYKVEDWSRISVDGGGVEGRGSGYAIAAYSRYWHFFRGGVLVGNPVEPEICEPVFVRLFDFPGNQYSPSRSNALEVAGGILAVFNAYSHGVLHSPGGAGVSKRVNYVNGPSLLVYITPPYARIVKAVGGRITSMTKKGGSILFGTNNMPNLGGRDASKIDIGTREIVETSESMLISSSNPPVVFRTLGEFIGDKYFGGIPLTGYKTKRVKIYSSKTNKLEIYEYDLGLPPQLIDVEKIDLKEGLNTIELSNHDNIVSFRLSTPDEKARLYIILNPY